MRKPGSIDIAISLALVLLAATSVLSIEDFPHPSAQRRDFLTVKEVEALQYAQRIDLRIRMLTGAAERRFALLGATVRTRKEWKDWGEPPVGTREEFLRDIDRILMKAIDDLDYTATEDTSAKFFRNAFDALGAACLDYEKNLRSLMDKAESDRERGVILSSLERCGHVAEASSKLK